MRAAVFTETGGPLSIENIALVRNNALLKDTPKNTYRANGHNYQRPGLEIYLPGNGGLLAAVALMAAGWDGGPDRPAPGFPSDGSWKVRVEGVRKMP